MRNILLFIRRFFNLFLFLILQGIAIYILVTYNKSQQAVFAGVANEVTGSLSEKYNNVEYYFDLKKTNEQLVAENARLRNELQSSYGGPDTAHITIIDSLLKDTLGIRQYSYMQAKVVNNSVSQENNYITIHRGTNQGVNTNMVAIGPDGIVGKVVFVSDNYARLMSVLNRNFTLRVMMKKDLYMGDILWDGSSPEYIQMKNVSKSSKVQKGDTVVTSNITGLSFPPGVMVGTVENIIPDNGTGSGFLTLKIKTSTNFFTLQYVYLIDNMFLDEQKDIEAKRIKGQ